MRRALSALVVALVLAACAGAGRVHAQSPAPATTEVDDGDAKPWGRLLIFVPLSIAIGAGAMYGLRFARQRGWTSA